MIDDVWSLRPETKLVAQAAAAVLAVAGGLRLDCFGHTPVLGAALLDAVLTGVWIVLITNALNLTDGLDGLASGIGLISLLWMAATAAHTVAHSAYPITTFIRSPVSVTMMGKCGGLRGAPPVGALS